VTSEKFPGFDQKNIWELVEKIWDQSGAWPEFIQVMRFALYPSEAGERDPSGFSALPGLCCQAAGGQPEWADPVAAAWLLFYAAAHIMDSLEDQDPPDAWWAEGGPPVALNAFTGLFFSATLALQELSGSAVPMRTARETARQMLQSLMQMCSGQFADVTSPPCSLEEYWRIAAAKSGTFFGLACRAGARLATSRRTRLDWYEQFGRDLGLVIQVLDDLGDLRDLMTPGRTADAQKLKRSLPAIYIREVCTAPVQEHFEQLAAAAPENPDAARELGDLFEANGGVLYLLAELEMHRQGALQGLQRAYAASPAVDYLAILLDRISSLPAR
jgi:geranylgeranyl pyrophosphate synthase